MSVPSSGDALVRILLLGGFAVQVRGQPVPEAAWGLRKARDLLKLLALAPGHRLHREQVMERLWPDRTPVANNLHQVLHAARKALGNGAEPDPRLLTLHDGILTLCPDGSLWVDAEAFEAAATEARAGGGIAACRAALDLYRGELLPDDRYEEWTLTAREALAHEHLQLLAQLARLQEDDGDLAGSIDTVRELLHHDPADEAAHRSLMRLYALSGQRRLAVRQFEVLRTSVRRALDVEPDEESERLYRDILDGSAHNQATAVEPLPAAPRPAGRSAGNPSRRRPDNLPVQLSSFIGRERELIEIRRLLAGTRVLSLTGAGGSGKTRLALEAGASAAGFPDGVWLAELAALSHPSLVVQAVAEVFEVREQPGRPLIELVAAYLADRELLLVLDNCEHLVEACARVAEDLLRSCPNLRILATSREPLRIPGEVVFRVPSLELPDPLVPSDLGELARFASVRLFVERAQAADPAFALTAGNAGEVARLCYHLDGLPLAIELAASRAAVLPVAAIAARLHDRFGLLTGGSRTALTRQQTLRAALDWSYNLLAPAEQSMLRTLSVFVGGFTLDAAEAVGEPLAPEPVGGIGLLGQLVDKSLVVLDDRDSQARYRLLESIREYGHGRLVECGEQAAAEAGHAAWFAGLAEQAMTALPRGDRGAWLERAEAEHDNLRAAFDRSLGPDPQRALRLAASLWPFWLWRGHLAEGRRRLGLVLDRVLDRTALRAEALLGAAALTIRSGKLSEGAGLAGESVETFRELGDQRGCCRALQVLGVAAWSEDDLVEAKRIYQESLAVATAAGSAPGQAAAMHALGIVCWYAGEQERADTLLASSLRMFRTLTGESELAPPMLDVGEILMPQPESGGMRMVFVETFAPFQDVPCRTAAGYVLANQGMLDLAMGNHARARKRIEESLALFEAIADERAVGQALGRLGILATAEGDLPRARELLTKSLEVRRRAGDTRGMSLAMASLGNVATAEADYVRARELLDDSVATFRRRGDMWGYGSALGNRANLAIAEDDQAAARRLLEESLTAIRATGRSRWIAWTLLQLAAVVGMQRDHAHAEELTGQALAIFRRLGDQLGVDRCLALLGAPAKR